VKGPWAEIFGLKKGESGASGLGKHQSHPERGGKRVVALKERKKSSGQEKKRKRKSFKTS